MTSNDERFALIFNGAIYNHRVLREELESSGYRFHTHCDTEVLLNAWHHWGSDALPRLRGMFAFAVWDRSQNSLTLVRDPLEIKPLYYSETAGQLLLASVLNALCASRQFDQSINPHAVDQFLARLSVPAPETIYQDAKSLRPGGIDGLARRGPHLHRFWKCPSNHSVDAIDPTEFKTALRNRFKDSIDAHRLADGPVCAFLSGGLDSAVVTRLMARRSSAPLKTFSLGFAETDYSELTAAEETARHYGTDHHSVTLSGQEAADELPRYVDSLDQPVGDGFNTYLISRIARQGGVTAALSGLGGDEIFGGYPSFRDTPRIAKILPVWHLVPRSIRELVCRRLDRGDSGRRKLAGMLRHAGDIHEVADRQRQVFSDEARQMLMETPHSPRHHNALPELREALRGASPAAIVSAWEIRTYMADVLLRDSDVFSMRASLELRVPFVDRPLIEWLWRQPSHLRIRSSFSKAALYESVEDILPPSLRDRPKRGFTLPFPLWMRRELRPFIEDTLSSASLARQSLLDPVTVASQWATFRDGTDDKQWSRVWNLVILIAFLNRTRIT